MKNLTLDLQGLSTQCSNPSKAYVALAQTWLQEGQTKNSDFVTQIRAFVTSYAKDYNYINCQKPLQKVKGQETASRKQEKMASPTQKNSLEPGAEESIRELENLISSRIWKGQNMILGCVDVRPLPLRALAILDAERHSRVDPEPFPLLKLPIEIRLKIYRNLFAGRKRHIDVYSLLPGLAGGLPMIECWSDVILDIDVAILRTCREIHVEAESELYSSHVFGFRHILSGVVPFLQSLSPVARSYIHYIALDIRVCPQPKTVPVTPDSTTTAAQIFSQETTQVCEYLGQSLQLRALRVTFDDGLVTDLHNLHWLKKIARIRGLQRLVVMDISGGPYPFPTAGWRPRYEVYFQQEYGASLKGGAASLAAARS